MTDQQPNPWVVFAVLAPALVAATLNFSLVFVAFGDIVDEFGGDSARVSWALTAFSIALAAMLIPAGWLADRYGRRRMVMFGIVVFAFGSTLVATAPNIGMLIVGRIFQALGLASESSASFAIVVDAFPPNRRSTAVGALGASGGVAAALGPVVGGVLVDGIGWRWTFALNVPTSLAALACIAVLLPVPAPSPTTRRNAPDLLGIAGLVLGVGSLALAIVEVHTWGVTSWRTLGAVAIAVTALGAMVRRSANHPDPVLSLPLLADRQFRLGSMLNLVIAGSFAGGFLTFITLMTEGWGMSRLDAGLAVAVIPLFGGPLSFVAGRLADQRGHRLVITIGAVIIALAGGLVALTVPDERAVATWWLPIGALYGIGVGFAHAACHAAAMRDVEPSKLGVGGAMSRIFMEVGAVISVAVSIALVSAAGDPVAGTRRVCLLLGAIGLAGAAIASRLRPVRPVADAPATASV